MMNNVAVLGNFAGDEGKGAITHHLSKDYSFVIRFSGGANAGHTIYRDGVKFVHNLLPSVDYRHKHIRSYLGAGMVIDLEKLLQEVVEADKHYPGVGKTIYVDKDAFLVQDKHKKEDAATNAHIGSTNRGIGPAYKDKVCRSGVRIGDILSHKNNCENYEVLNNIINNLTYLGVSFSYTLDMYNELKSSYVLFEGAQGIMIDLNAGSYPYVSCGDSTLAGIYSSGFGFIAPNKVYGVGKGYSTKVGEGPFPTEYFGEEAETLRKLGNEYGATTGRPRRVGALDLPALRYAIKRGGLTNLILTKLDILDYYTSIKVCHKYDNEPVSGQDFFNAKPEYTYLPGWQQANDINQTRDFIEFIEEQTGLRVEYVSCGVNPADIIKLH